MAQALGPRPFVKWAGSKRLLLAEIVPYVPKDFGTYYEPFLGGGSVFLALDPGKAVLSDACKPLIDTWTAVGRNPDGVSKSATSTELSERAYYEVRAARPTGYLQQAGRFIYLNKGAFNGLYRENLRGEFNVPWGRPKSPFIVDRENLRAVSARLRAPAIEIRCRDFEESIDASDQGDLVFVDPPYVTGHNDNGFIEYNAKIFGWHDQQRLAAALKRAQNRSVHIVATNADHPEIRKLYSFLAMRSFERSSTLAANVAKRGRVRELLMTSEANDG